MNNLEEQIELVTQTTEGQHWLGNETSRELVIVLKAVPDWMKGKNLQTELMNWCEILSENITKFKSVQKRITLEDQSPKLLLGAWKNHHHSASVSKQGWL